jgi:hypothetical protein
LEQQGVIVGVGAAIYLAKKSGERSEDPIAKRDVSNTRKEAEEKARIAGHGKPSRGPEKHNDGKPPHFHPNLPKDNPKSHDHYYFPKSKF